MKKYPEDWDLERISDDQTGKGLLGILIIMVVVFGLLAATGKL